MKVLLSLKSGRIIVVENVESVKVEKKYVCVNTKESPLELFVVGVVAEDIVKLELLM